MWKEIEERGIKVMIKEMKENRYKQMDLRKISN